MSFPLSFQQRRLWLIDAMEPESGVYVVASAWRITGPLKIGALESAVEALVERHASLRTTFALRNGEPVQIVTDHGNLTLRIVDLADWSPAERETECRHIIDDVTGRGFDLAVGPLFRPVLIRLAPEDHVLVFARHHIINDARSNEIYSRDLNLLYRAFANGEPCELEPLSLQYGDYAVRQHERLAGDVLARDLSYWRGYLEGAPSFLDLPTDHPRTPAQTFRGARERRVLDPTLADAVVTFARKHRCTPFMVLLAAYNALLHRYTGAEDLVVGTPIANRDAGEADEIIG
ncbi:MAG TPA: condensation domain-containing protein, partial [Candidatus Acidoferrum sp.]|nr:condensation domain-containing protein [Candidatus Acidoferrum sp.]